MGNPFEKVVLKRILDTLVLMNRLKIMYKILFYVDGLMKI